MAYYKNQASEQVGYNLLAQRTQQLSMLNNRASSSFLNGKPDDYFFSLIALRQNLTPNLKTKEKKILDSIESQIHELKIKAVRQYKESNVDQPGFILMSRFKKNRNHSNVNQMSRYVEKIKKFEQALLIVMKKKGFYPGKADASSMM